MSEAPADALARYSDGLDSVLDLLTRVLALADAQRTAARERDLTSFMTLSDERDALTSTIVMLDARIAPLRAALGLSATPPSPATGLVERHRQARAAVDRILALDRDTHTALADADRARRDAAQILEAGEQTLAAYRRVISANRTSALIDARS